MIESPKEWSKALLENAQFVLADDWTASESATRMAIGDEGIRSFYAR